MNKLAIVIPAYKKKYFAQALNSLVSQTNKNFNVYVGDDHSPEDLKGVVDSFANKLSIFYTRFPNNIGAEQLVHQWNRCINLTQREEWLWLFSDDDLLDPNCVEVFYQALEARQPDVEVYRFNTSIINGEGEVTTVMPVSPAYETSEEMAYYLLRARRGNSMPDHIFTRSVYERNGGFVFTPFAQGADWAMSILFSQQKGICALPAQMYWRLSGSNISSMAPERKTKMLQGHIEFISWVIQHFQYLKQTPGPIPYNEMLKAAIFNLEMLIRGHYKTLDKDNMRRCYSLFRRQLRWPAYAAFEMVLRLGMHNDFFVNKLYRLNNVLRRLGGGRSAAAAWVYD